MPAKTRIAAEREITETANRRSAEARRAANRRSLKLSVVGKRFSPHAGGSDLESHRRQAVQACLSLLDACR